MTWAMIATSANRFTAGFRRRITWAGVAFIVLIIAADAYEAWQDHAAAVARSQSTLSGLSRALAGQTARMIEEIDVALADYAAWSASTAGEAATADERRERLRRRVAAFPFVHSAAVFGSDGAIQLTSRSAEPADLNVSQGPAFAMHQRDGADLLYISKPVVGRSDRYLTFALSRRLEDPHGHFAGVVAARVAFEYLTRFYATINIGADASIRLFRDDGVTLAEYPERTAGRSLVARQRIEGYPLAVEMSWPLASALRPWVAEEEASALRTATLALLAILLLIALNRALRRRDLADLRRRNLERRISDLRKHQALGSLAAATAHDFNNVLSAIVGNAELARSACRDSVEAQALLDRLLAAAERARQLVRRVLTFDRNRSVTYVPTNLAMIVREVLDQVRATLPQSIRLIAPPGSGHAWILGDATEIYQVAMNLCTNAVQAMPAGGEIEVRIDTVDVREERSLRAGLLRPGRWLRLAVADAGDGLDPAQLERIFEPFFTTKRDSAGTGIGLAVVRNIVSRMGGALDVESVPGSGARFLVYWPQIVEVPSTGRAVRDVARGNGETVLVVDDDPELVTLAEDLLAMLGYEPVGFSDGRSALEAFRRDPGRFDAVITDERMPALRGTLLARAIHALRSDVPVILMTGHRESDLDARADAAGVAQVIEKPLRAQDLERALDRELRRGGFPAAAG